MRALVIGGSGFLGLELCKTLQSKGIEIRSFQRHHSKSLHALNIPQVLGSLEQEANVEEAVMGCQAVFHCGGKVDADGSREEHFRINSFGSQNVLRASLKHQVKAFVLTSTPSVFVNGKGIYGLSEGELEYSKLDFPYVQSKIAAEKQILSLHRELLPYVILRPHQIWAEGSTRFTEGLLRVHSQLKIIGDGKNRVDSIHVKDAAEAHYLSLLQLLKNPETISGKDYNLSSSRPFLLWESIIKIYLENGLAPITKKIPLRLARTFNRWKWWTSSSARQHAEYLTYQLAIDRWFDCSRAWRELSFECRRFQ